MSAAFDIATKLAALSFGTIGTDIGVNNFLNRDANEIAVFEFAGEQDEMTHGGIAFEYPNIQVQVRHRLNQTAESRARAAYVALRDLKDQTLNGHLYHWLEPKRSQQKLNVDEEGRTVWYFELKCHRRPVS